MRVRAFGLICSLLLLLIHSAAGRADDVAAFHAAIEKVNQPYKSALFYLRTGNAGVAGLELATATAAWDVVVERYAKTPPAPLTQDPVWPDTLHDITAAFETGQKLAESGESKSARKALLPIRNLLHQMRKRNGLRVLADCVFDLNGHMDVLYHWRHNRADFSDAQVRAKAAEASSNYIDQLKLCRSEAPQAVKTDADFQSVMDGAARSAGTLLRPIERQDPDAFINVLRELKSFDVIIFVRWG
ncbi:MAG: hypothetical protein AAGF81_22560 [Pseudomonadota bacterium]